jgi:subtilisin family serine protease
VFDTTQTILPGNAGLLMNRQLPTPPKLSITAAKDASGNAIAEPNELLVVSSNMEEAKQLAQQLKGYGLSPKKRKVLKNLGIVMTTYRVPTDIDIQQTAINIRQAYPDMWADINHRYTLQSDTRSTHAAKKQINWNASSPQCGKGLRIGLIDTEINKLHPALKDQKITSHSVLSQGIKKAKKSHATAIATLLIGSSNSESFSGMLPAAKLFSASVFRQRDKKNIDTTAEWIVNALDWLLSQNVQVINMSVGGPRNLLVDIAIQRTIKSGIAVIAAAGNGGHSATAVYPAAQTGVIAVTAVDSEMNIYSKANYGEYIDFAAPGVDIWAGNEKGAGKFVSGTSFSVPFVTAAIANIVNTNGPKKAYLQLQNNATDLGEKGKDEQFGWGVLQAASTCL